jgi:hypothetical protein
LRAALRWAVEQHRRQQGQHQDGQEAATTIYLPTRWPHLLTLGELVLEEKGCVRACVADHVDRLFI